MESSRIAHRPSRNGRPSRTDSASRSRTTHRNESPEVEGLIQNEQQNVDCSSKAEAVQFDASTGKNRSTGENRNTGENRSTGNNICHRRPGRAGSQKLSR